MSEEAVVVAGMADGRIWIGMGGEKSQSTGKNSKKKRSRKWDGLKHDQGGFVHVAEGPIVGV
jgi:hypothetical protein